MKAFRPFFVIISLILIVGLACSFGSGSGNDDPTEAVPPTAEQSEPTEDIEEEPTDEEPVDEPTEEEPTEEASNAEAEAYYTETFDGNIDNYTYFNTGEGDEDKMTLETDDGSLVFDLKDENLWIYVTYNAFTYEDVSLEVVADNRGKNSNNISLLCRYDPDEGWYEFNISNGGLYDIFAYDATGAVRKGYNSIVNGASKAVKQGREINTYGASCIGDELTLTINGEEVKSIKDSKYKFREGKVGFSVSSFNVLPILVNVDEFTILEP